MGRIALIWLIAILAAVISGCNGSRETDEVAYVLALGVDAAEEGMLEVTYQLAVPRTVGSEGGPKSIEEASEIITIKAPSLAEARVLANSTVARSLNISHVKAIIIGEKLARRGIGDMLAAMNRYREYRGSMFFMVVRSGTAKEFIQKVTPKQEVLPSRFFETMLNDSGESGYYIPSTLHTMYTRMVSGSAAPYATLVAVKTAKKETGALRERTTADRAYSYDAGDIPYDNTGNPVEFSGVAVFFGDRMVGYLDNVDTRQLAIVLGNYQKGFITIADPQVSGKSVNVNLREGRTPKLSVAVVDGKLRLEADVLLEGEITSIASGVNYENPKYREQLEQQLSTALEQETREMFAKSQALRSDLTGFGYPARKLFATYPEYRQAYWGDMYQNADIQVKIAVKLRRTSLMRKTSPVQNQ